MKIGGFQKTTLLDFPGRVAAIVFTSGCNFRCPFCHNSALVLDKAENLDETEILEYLKMRRGVLDGVSISGGEPLMQKGLIPFLRKIREIGLEIKIDTNGSFPSVLRDLIDEGLIDYIAMDVKTSIKRYPELTGCDQNTVEKIKRSIDIIMSSGLEYEFRTTVVREHHTKSEIAQITELISGAEKYFLQTYKDGDENLMSGMSAYSQAEMDSLAAVAAPFVKTIMVR